MSVHDVNNPAIQDMSQLCQGSNQKPLEIYLFIDPLCPQCWALEPVLKKLQIEYGKYFTLKHILSGRLGSLNLNTKKKFENMAQYWEKTASHSGMSCDGTLWIDNPIETPYAASIAIKAAELQGKRPGIRFLRKLREYVFLDKQNVSDEDVLLGCAEEVGLDVEEFKRDLYSESAVKAFQCDVKISGEMDVQEIPTLVFFNEDVEEEGIKISGSYPYEMYVEIIHEMLGCKPEPHPLPPLEVFLRYFDFVATKEIAVVYDLPLEDAKKEMKKLRLLQKVEEVPVKHGTFWKYIDE